MTHTLSTHSDAVHAALHLLADDMGCEIPPLGHLTGTHLSARPHQSAGSRSPA